MLTERLPKKVTFLLDFFIEVWYNIPIISEVDMELSRLDRGAEAAASARAPEGYEQDFITAERIKRFIQKGGRLEDLEPPKNWREVYLALCIWTELPPSLCAREAGVTLAFIRMYLSTTEDAELVSATQCGRAGNFESRVDNPGPRELRAASIPLAALKYLSEWRLTQNRGDEISEETIKELKIMRREINGEMDAHDRQEEAKIENLRATTAYEARGVIGLDD